MSLPTSRDTTFTVLAPVPSAFLNSVQDAIIGLAQQRQNMIDAFLAGMVGRHMANFPNGAPAAVQPLAGAANPFNVSAGDLISFRAGLLVSTGGPAAMPYVPYLVPDDAALDTQMNAPPGAGQFRRDIVSVKVDLVAGVSVLTKAYTVGTPAGTEVGAVDAATPSGYTKIASILLSGASVGTIDPLKVRDYRFPLGYSDVIVPPRAMIADIGTANWESSGDTYQRNSGGAGQVVAAVPWNRPLNHHVRLRQIFVHSNLAASVVVKLMRRGWLTTSGGNTDLTTEGEPAITITTGLARWVITPTWPVWGNGCRSPERLGISGSNMQRNNLLLEFTSVASTSVLFGVGFEFYGGLAL